MTQTEFLKYLAERVSDYQSRFDLNTGQAFAMWYAIESLELEEDEAYEAVSYDGGNDKDVDLFFVDEKTERVLVGQLKYRGNGTYKAKKGELLSLIHTTDWLKDPVALRREGRSDLAEAAEEYATATAKGYSVEYLYIFTGPTRPDVDDAARQFNVTEAGNVPSRSCRVVALSFLIAEHEELIDQSTRITDTTIPLAPASHFEESGAFGKAVVATLSGDQLRQLHAAHGDRLFDRNVRLFLGARKGGVNGAIRDTLDSTTDRKNFWAYNNGITFICDRYDLKKDSLILHNFSIVNGCQTTVSFANSPTAAARDARVLARFIAAPERAIDSIIRYTNSQNPIRLWDLTAQDKLQKRLKKQLGNLPQPFLYVLRRGETRTLDAAERKKFRRTDGTLCVIQHDLNAQYLAAFRGLPAIAYKDKGKIFSSHYDDVYPPQIRPEEVVLVWQAGCVAQTIVRESLEKAVQEEDTQRIGVLKRGAKFFVVGAMGLILHERNGKTFLNKIKPEVATSKATAVRIKNYAIVALEWYVEATRDLMDAGAEVTTLVRSQDSWTKTAQKIISKWNVYKLAKKAMEETLPTL